MASTDSAAREQALMPLIESVRRGRYLRLAARPGHVMGERPEGDAVVSIPWTLDQHTAALAFLQTPVHLEAGVIAARLGDTVMIQGTPEGLWRSDDLAREGWLSALSARTLSAALALGRNILITGPWALCMQLMTTLVGEGSRPALLSGGPAIVPPRWGVARDAAEVLGIGADRVAAWDLPMDALTRAMGRLCGVMAWCEARRLDRALMRFEAGIEAQGRGATPLHVLAGLDLVVVATQHGGPRVREI
ncbi:MAG TPA: hypothetical protein VFH51_00440, partial [Myxococcota bacterium]|nr:hypothetical protein [Myxococcota bacterium]